MAAEDYDGVPRVNISDHDILLGRGRGPSNHVGNKRFLAVCKLHEEEYNGTSSFKKKGAIANEVFCEVSDARNARFLQLVPTGQPMRNVVEEGEWVVASKKASMDKIKQALREKRSDEHGQKESIRTAALESVSSRTAEANRVKVPPYTAALRNQPIVSEPSSAVEIDWSCQEDNLFGGVMVGNDLWAVSDATELQSDAIFASKYPIDDFSFEVADAMKASDHLNDGADDEKTLLLKSTRVEKRRRSGGSTSSIISRVSSISSLDSFSFVSPRVFDDKRSSFIDTRLLLFGTDPSSLQQQTADFASLSIDEEELLTAPLPDEQASESLLYLLGMASGQPLITEEELVAERATMTGEEKAAALSDVFGKYCNVECPRDKRARVETDRDSIDLLLNKMRLEIAMIPKVKRKAITEAITKCAPSEFSEKRLERFLRCEDMDAKRGAQRFVNYWDTRRKLFGPDKFLLPMQLSEALRDDLDAIEDGVFVILPHLDMSGRIIQFLEPYRRREGRYSSQSLVRSPRSVFCGSFTPPRKSLMLFLSCTRSFEHFGM